MCTEGGDSEITDISEDTSHVRQTCAQYLSYHERSHYLSHLWTTFHLTPRHSFPFSTVSTECRTESLVFDRWSWQISAEAPGILTGSPVPSQQLSRQYLYQGTATFQFIIRHSFYHRRITFWRFDTFVKGTKTFNFLHCHLRIGSVRLLGVKLHLKLTYYFQKC